MHDVVALLEDRRAADFESGEPLLLRRGQIGTIVMLYGDGACEVEFTDRDGRAYALETVPVSGVMVLHEVPERVAV